MLPSARARRRRHASAPSDCREPPKGLCGRLRLQSSESVSGRLMKVTFQVADFPGRIRSRLNRSPESHWWYGDLRTTIGDTKRCGVTGSMLPYMSAPCQGSRLYKWPQASTRRHVFKKGPYSRQPWAKNLVELPALAVFVYDSIPQSSVRQPHGRRSIYEGLRSATGTCLSAQP